ncbi:hypothetical protein OG21DRAFT_1142444 [Imleria badia]|nr:hypothetical protein OG21DRAFT_1142444 [Imleria badia]
MASASSTISRNFSSLDATRPRWELARRIRTERNAVPRCHCQCHAHPSFSCPSIQVRIKADSPAYFLSCRSMQHRCPHPRCSVVFRHLLSADIDIQNAPPHLPFPASPNVNVMLTPSRSFPRSTDPSWNDVLVCSRYEWTIVPVVSLSSFETRRRRVLRGWVLVLVLEP